MTIVSTVAQSPPREERASEHARLIEPQWLIEREHESDAQQIAEDHGGLAVNSQEGKAEQPETGQGQRGGQSAIAG